MLFCITRAERNDESAVLSLWGMWNVQDAQHLTELLAASPNEMAASKRSALSVSTPIARCSGFAGT